ncbi:C40 family peptidase [Kribbella sp. NBC_01245]|uniref:C40 family peptidase n=1 Tax=Kribbella sp. NBC_01245 TaxID=2903578 RepID=UPI002E2AF7BD|nr:C40 family peptidase [Kribbella sp. NBC_01245]
MRTVTGARSGRVGRHVLAGVLAISMTGSMALTVVPAYGDPTPPVIPSQGEVDAAKKAAAAKAAQVAAIEQRLAGATDRLELLGQVAERAAEAYNGAVYKLGLAKADAKAAAERAQKAERTLDAQRRQIGRFAAASYQGGGELAQVAPLFRVDGPQELLDSAGANRSISSAMQASYLRYSATQLVRNAFRLQAAEALKRVAAATRAAAVAKAQAEAAQRSQAAAVSAMGVERKSQITQLAKLRQTSYQVAEQRQNGLEELARQRAAAEAARKAEELRMRAAAKAAAEAAERAAEAAKQASRAKAERARKAAERAEQAAKRAREAKTRAEREKAAREAEEAARQAEKEAGRGGNDDDEPGRSGIAGVIDFARAQLGEPYVWGAEGPSSWDCSGLTMKAWARAGVQLPHYSVAQYEQVRKISEDELRPGDLIFWSEDADDPGTIFHVALYIGEGRMIHAPRTGRPVRIDSVYYWEAPDFFGRP